MPIQQFTPTMLAEVVRRQPPSSARTTFAWQIAVGAALARVTTVIAVDGVLVVRPADERWAPEIARARDTVLARLQHLLGADEVLSIRVDSPAGRVARRRTRRT